MFIAIFSAGKWIEHLTAKHGSPPKFAHRAALFDTAMTHKAVMRKEIAKKRIDLVEVIGKKVSSRLIDGVGNELTASQAAFGAKLDMIVVEQVGKLIARGFIGELTFKKFHAASPLVTAETFKVSTLMQSEGYQEKNMLSTIGITTIVHSIPFFKVILGEELTNPYLLLQNRLPTPECDHTFFARVKRQFEVHTFCLPG